MRTRGVCGGSDLDQAEECTRPPRSLLRLFDRLVQLDQLRSDICELSAEGGWLDFGGASLKPGDSFDQLIQGVSERDARHEGQGGTSLGLLDSIGAAGDSGFTSVDDLLNPVACGHGERFCPTWSGGRPPARRRIPHPVDSCRAESRTAEPFSPLLHLQLPTGRDDAQKLYDTRLSL
jgi:hypothetical protein